MGNIFIRSCDNNPNVDNDYYCRGNPLKPGGQNLPGYCIGEPSQMTYHDIGSGGIIRYTKWNDNVGDICQDDYIAKECKHSSDTINNSNPTRTGCMCVPNTKENNPLGRPTCGVLKPIPTAIAVAVVVGIIFFASKPKESENFSYE